MISLPKALSEEIIDLIHQEQQFLDEVERCADQIAVQVVGQPFPNDLIENLIRLHTDAGSCVQRRSLIRQKLASAFPSGTELRLSRVNSGAPEEHRLHGARQELIRKSERVQQQLRQLQAVLKESDATVSSILGFLTGGPAGPVRYDDAGRIVKENRYRNWLSAS